MIDFTTLGTKKIKSLEDLEKALMYDSFPIGKVLSEEENNRLFNNWYLSMDFDTKKDLHIIFSELSSRRKEKAQDELIRHLLEKLH